MQEAEQRSRLLARLTSLAAKLPNGLLYRLVEDAQFFYDWNLAKRKARKSSRISQQKAWTDKDEDQRWREFKKYKA